MAKKWPWEVKRTRRSRKTARAPSKARKRTGGASKATLSAVMKKAGAYRRQGATPRQALKKAWGTVGMGRKATTRKRRSTRRRRY